MLKFCVLAYKWLIFRKFLKIPPSMKKTLLILFTSLSFLNAQTVVLKPFNTKVVKGTEEHLKSYDLLRLDANQITEQIDAIKGNVKEITLRTPNKTFQLQLFEYSLIDPSWKRGTGDPNNITRLPFRKDFRTFNGTIKGVNSIVSMSLAGNGFFKIMIDDRQERYFIEPLDLASLSPDIPQNQQFIFYKTSDVIPKEGIRCGSDYVDKGVQDELKRIESRGAPPCKQCVEVKICLAADYTMYRKYGANVVNTENQMITILADVQTVFDDEFEHEYQYQLTGTFVADDPAKDPFNGITDINAQLTQFAAVAPSMFSQSQYNVATNWSAKWSTGVIGLAYLATVCMNDRYNVCSDFIGPGGRQGDYLTLQAHELGHNWSMIHDIANAPTIMSPTINGSRWWSFQSVYYLNNYVTSYRLIESMCLLVCPSSQAPVPDFTSDKVYGCQPVTVRYKDLSLYTTTWNWSFPGGTPATSTQQNPVVVYRTPGVYEVSLEAGNHRCKVSKTVQDYMTVNDVPHADFSFGLDGRTVYFINQSLRGITYLWKFGNGDESDEEFPTYEYQKDTSYDVTLIVTNDCGIRTIKKRINIVSIPIPEFDSDTTGGCAPKIIKFMDQSSNNVISWDWKFPGGTPSFSLSKNPFVKYTNPGIYDVSLTVYSSRYSRTITKKLYIAIDSAPAAEFSHTINNNTVLFTGQARYAKTHLWDFGDGKTSTDSNPSHDYLEGRYEVKYIVTNACGDDTAKTIITVGAKPIAGFKVSDGKGCTPFKLQFTNTSTAAATAFRWYFPGGNPSTSTDKDPLVTYNNAGKFDVSLYAYNNFFSDSIGIANFVEVKTEPVSAFTNAITGFKSAFTHQASGATFYFWDFGDGRASFEENPVHDYGVEGEFDVKLIVQNECGQDTFEKRVAVYIVPKVNYGVDTIRGCAPLKVQFTDKSSIDVIEWDWQFENGNPATSKEKNPVVVFDKKGRYTVKLTVKNTNGTNALTRPQFIHVLSPVLCPEHTKTNRFVISENPFGFNWDERSAETTQILPVVYPNPASDYITVATGLEAGEFATLLVYDLSGNNILHINCNQQIQKIQTSQFVQGTYYIKLVTRDKNAVRKFVITR
jgi:PKD repeat protein